MLYESGFCTHFKHLKKMKGKNTKTQQNRIPSHQNAFLINRNIVYFMYYYIFNFCFIVAVLTPSTLLYIKANTGFLRGSFVSVYCISNNSQITNPESVHDIVYFK